MSRANHRSALQRVFVFAGRRSAAACLSRMWRVKHTISTPSLRALSRSTAAPSRSLVSTVLLTNEGYDTKQVTELRALLRQRGLTTSGRKAELVQRLKQSDMTRAGSTLASADKAPQSRAKKGRQAVQDLEEKQPSLPMEPGTVVSATAVRQGQGAGTSSSSPQAAQPQTGAVRGQPALTPEASTPTFDVQIPSEPLAEPEAQYIPSIKPLTDPTSHNYTDPTRESDLILPHVPRMYRVAQDADVAHIGGLAWSEKHGGPSSSRNVVLDVLSDALPTQAHKKLEHTWHTASHASSRALSNMASEVTRVVPIDPSVAPSTSHARPSARRPLNESESRGLWVLGGIVATGMAVGSWMSQDRPPRAAAAAAAAPHPAAQPPVYAHGGGIVGGGARRV